MRKHGHNYDEAHEIANKTFDWWAVVQEMERKEGKI